MRETLRKTDKTPDDGVTGTERSEKLGSPRAGRQRPAAQKDQPSEAGVSAAREAFNKAGEARRRAKDPAVPAKGDADGEKPGGATSKLKFWKRDGPKVDADTRPPPESNTSNGSRRVRIVDEDRPSKRAAAKKDEGKREHRDRVAGEPPIKEGGSHREDAHTVREEGFRDGPEKDNGLKGQLKERVGLGDDATSEGSERPVKPTRGRKNHQQPEVFSDDGHRRDTGPRAKREAGRGEGSERLRGKQNRAPESTEVPSTQRPDNGRRRRSRRSHGNRDKRRQRNDASYKPAPLSDPTRIPSSFPEEWHGALCKECKRPTPECGTCGQIFPEHKVLERINLSVGDGGDLACDECHERIPVCSTCHVPLLDRLMPNAHA